MECITAKPSDEKCQVPNECNQETYDSKMPGDDYEDKGSSIRFFPPAYVQRYNAVQDILSSERYKGKLRKIVEFGCSELNFVVYMKNMNDVEEIICIDIDRQILDIHKEKSQPLHADYLHERDRPLKISIYEGSVTHSDKILQNTDAVIGIELIEHLYQDTLQALPANVFGYIKPRIAIFTTPNSEFNVLFTGLTGFRHHDHKFEWTRQEFQNWANKIIQHYPDYEVTFHGICNGPKGTEHLGCCSQMAVFHRLIEVGELSKATGVEGLFKEVANHKYPYRIDTRSDEEKILDDATYYIRQYSSGNCDYAEEIPLKLIRKAIWKFNVTQETLREVLVQDGWTIEQREVGLVIIVPPPTESLSEHSIYEEDFLDNETLERDDDWNYQPGPPAHYSDEYIQNRFFNVENTCDENWDDEDVTAPAEVLILKDDCSKESRDCTNQIISSSSLKRNCQDWISSTTELENFVSDQPPSMCSIFLERSREGTRDKCPLDFSNESTGAIPAIKKLRLESMELELPQFASTPQAQKNMLFENKSEIAVFESESTLVKNSEAKKTESEQLTKVRSKLTIFLKETNGESAIINESTKDEAENKEIIHVSKAVNRVSLDGTETPPNSFSLEVIDSGYPNSASMADISPDFNLPSIADDRITDSESPSVAEAPRPGFLEVIEVENGDLANNNRDDEGNYVIAAVEREIVEDLQPLINVLENDMENENDIYVLQNGFPIWLLRILEMANPVEVERVGQNLPVFEPPPPHEAAGEI